MKIHSILRGHSWEEFVESIKHDNRFHTQLINTDKLETYLSYLRKDYEKGKSMYRGRLCYSDKEYKPKEMGAPPIEFAKEGRANSTGIRRLYLADSEKLVFTKYVLEHLTAYVSESFLYAKIFL